MVVAVPAPAERPNQEASARRLLVCRLGLTDYQDAWNLQRHLAEARREERIPDVLLLVEHPHTYTLGRRSRSENVLLPESELGRRGIALYHVDRGGDVTYHGPGQLVAYPILKLPPERLDYVRYIRDVEQAMLLAVRDLGAPGELKEGFSGVWVGNDKVCAIGIKIDAWGVTTHGVALNVSTDLSLFQHIIPCGLSGKGVTSLERIKGRRVSMDRAIRTVTARLADAFDLAPRGINAARLAEMVERVTAAHLPRAHA